MTFVTDLLQQGVRLWVEGGELHYRAPKGVVTPALREELGRRKDIAALVGEGRKYAALSFAQQRLWFLDQMEPGSSFYNIPVAVRLTGPLDTVALRRTLGEIVRRHEAMRTSFTMLEGRPVQVIALASPGEPVLPVTDLRGLPPDAREAEARRLVAREAQQPFDLGRGPLWRAALLRLDAESHVLILTMHHIISDDWSIGVLIHEVAALYPAFCAGQPSPLPELPIQYADFAAWQRQHLQGPTLEAQLAYWTQHLKGAPAVLELPTDRPRPPVQTFAGTTQAWAWPRALSEAVKALSQRENVTLFMTLLAAFKTLLYRYTGQAGIVVGTPIANRTRSEIEGLIGFFVNTLVLHTYLGDNPTFLTLLGRVRETAMGAYVHQDLPFEMLVEKLQPERNLSYTPLFQVLFVLQNVPAEELKLPGLALDLFDVEGATAKFDLALYAWENERRLEGTWEYNTDLFDGATITRLAGHFQTLMEGIVANPERRLADLPLLTEAERQQLAGWNQTRSDYPRQACVHELFEEQARRTPDAVAVVMASTGPGQAGDQHLTYAGLNDRASQLACYLKKLGVGLESLVGLCIERSMEVVPAMLAILKAGGAYVPLDPSAPPDRLAAMLQDIQAPVVLTLERLLTRLPSMDDLAGPARPAVVRLDADWPQIAQAERSDLAGGAAADNLIYVMYTSGSTGQPKGISVAHRGVVRLVRNTNYARLAAEDIFFQYSHLSFDVSTFEIWGSLLNGGRLVVPPPGLLSLDELGQLIRQHGVTTLWLTAGLFHQVVDRRPQDLNVEQLLAGGDVLSVPHVLKVLRACPDCRFINGYGPTEATTFACCYTVQDPEQIRASVPIGRPIANTQAYVLDRDLHRVPVGVPGELCLGGDGVARGYLNRPDLTADKFVPDPFSGEPGARLYRTGDVVRYLPGGDLVFIGRSDYQVKIRGFRVELEEIEAVLGQHPAVRAAVVTAPGRPGEPGSRRLVAYVIPQAGHSPTPGALRDFLRDRLPEYMVPADWVFLDALPLTPSGKVNRRALPAPDLARPKSEEAFVAPRSEIERAVAAIWQDVLHLERVGVNDNFFDLGGHSLLVVQVHDRLKAVFGQDLPITDLFRYPSVAALAGRLGAGQDQGNLALKVQERAVARQAAKIEGPAPSRDVAIVGMAGRFPGADSPDQLWKNLQNGVESITFFSDQELLQAGVDPDLLNNPNYIKAGAIVPGTDYFDARFFGISAREAEIMDPQQRVFLECAWHALENAGYDPERYPGRIAVYAGESVSSYLLENLLPNMEIGAVGGLQMLISNDKDFVATQVAYRLNLTGPAITVQTACSTSLVAVHLACQGLLNHECDMALAGGVTLKAPVPSGYLYEGGIESRDGHCRAFDAGAQGTVFGSGVGLVVLKRLADALNDGDRIYAVIKGSAINNDGARKIGFTAPGEDGQAEVIAEALAVAGVEPDSITCVEAHGTGTPLGDPIEVAALTRAFRLGTQARGFCALGSVKTNLGHLDAAAGVTGLIKMVLALEHKQLPPSLHFVQPNPQIDLANSPFYVNTRLQEWRAEEGRPRRAGVSSFGIGGTNAHVILEEAPPAWPSDPGRPEHVLVLSAKTHEALEKATAQLAAWLRQSPGANLADVAYTLQVGRRAFAHRRAVIGRDAAQAAAALETLDPKQVFSSVAETRQRSLCFMFPGQGAQYVNMGRGLYESEPSFRASLEQCAALLQPHLGLDLLEVLYPPPGQEAAAAERLGQTALTQPALFAVEYALARLWQTWGLSPQAMIGHSIGEYVAACLAGVFTLPDALALVAQRGKLIQALPGGSMLSVSMEEAALRPFLTEPLAVAAINAPRLCTISGPDDAIEALQAQLEAQGIDCHRLHTSHAFHSAMMEPALGEFEACVGRITLNPPSLPFVSNVTGTWITARQATDPAYWARHLRQTVRFADGIQSLLEKADPVLLEVGPGRTLATLARQQQSQSIFTSLPHPQDRQADGSFLLTTLARLWLAGLEVDWPGLHRGQRRRRVPLPLYPFARDRYWIEARAHPAPATAGLSLHKRKPFAEWFYLPYWKPSLTPEPLASPVTWLVLGNGELGLELAERLRAAGQTVSLAQAGAQFDASDAQACTLVPHRVEDYGRLLNTLDPPPQRIVYNTDAAFDFFGLVCLAQALGYSNMTRLRLDIITHNAQQVACGETVDPFQALVLGPALVIPQEYVGLACHSIDVAAPSPACPPDRWYGSLLAELMADPPEPAVAYRDGQRWVQAFEPLTLPDKAPDTLRERGVYLITGGLGRIGRALARYLVETVQARLVLTGRSGLPPRAEWTHWLDTHEADDPTGDNIRFVQALEAQGGEVLVVAADAADPEHMRAALAQTRERFGALHGVLHAAGIVTEDAFTPIQAATRAACEIQFRPKVQGALVLAEVLRDQKLDFCLLFSSLSAVLGGLGFVAYAAANRFMDAVAAQQRRTGSTPWLSVNWDAWQFADEAPPAGDELAMSPAEGAQVFARVVGLTSAAQIVISIGDLQARLERWVIQHARLAEAGGAPAPLDQHARPELQTAYVAPRNDMEDRLAAIWSQLLGISPVGIHDNFFELGGHSLLATQLVSKIRDAFAVEISLRRFFEAPTVAELTLLVGEQQLGGQVEEHKLAALLSEVKSLPQDRLHRLLEEEEGAS